MSALRQSDFSPDYYHPQFEPNKAINQVLIARQSPVQAGKIVNSQAFPNTQNLPKNLKTLSLIQKGSFALAIATMSASISLYASSVKIPKLWSQEYQHLEDLQLQERQLVAVNETIKYQIAQEAASDHRLVISKPESAIFISPAQVQAKKPIDLEATQQKVAELKYNSLGY